MIALGSWRTSLVVHGLDTDRDVSVPVLVGLVETAAGVRVAVRVGYQRPVILALQEASQLALNVNEVTAERLRIAAEGLGGEDHDGGSRP